MRRDGIHVTKREFHIIHLKKIILIILFALIAPGLLGCYPKPVGPMGPEVQRLTWKEMSTQQRKAHMTRVVLPQAAALFRSWRPERFAKVDCGLCHGLGALTEDFKMPTAHLPRLSGELLLGPEFGGPRAEKLQPHHPHRVRLLLLPPGAERPHVRKRLNFLP